MMKSSTQRLGKVATQSGHKWSSRQTAAKGFLMILVLFYAVASAVSTRHIWHRDCNIETFRRHIREVCIIYIKRSAEYVMAPIANPGKTSGVPELARLWGYYLKEWETSRTNAKKPITGYLYQVAPKQATSGDIADRLSSSKKGSHRRVPENKTFINMGGNVPILVHVVSDILQSRVKSKGAGKQTELLDDPFRRMTRTATFRNLVAQCCNDGCETEDFIVLAEEFSVCAF